MRTPVVERIRSLLADAPRRPKSGLPATYSHGELARRVYEVDQPTAAQLSAVRRVVARLVSRGEAVRDTDRCSHGFDGQERGYHWRVYTWREKPQLYRNPPGVEVRRPMTAEDEAARREALEQLGLRSFAIEEA